MELTWIPIKEKCQHCGSSLEAAYDFNDNKPRMRGEYPLKYRHASTGESKCKVTTVYDVKPYKLAVEMAKSFDEARSKHYGEDQ